MSIIQKLLGLKSSQDYDQAISGLKQEIEAADAKISELDDKIKAAAFDVGEDEMKRLKTEQQTLDDYISTLTELLDEAERRRNEAIRREEGESLEKRMKAAAKDRRELVREYALLHETAKTMAECLRRCEQLTLSIKDANAAASTARRAELKVLPPHWVLSRMQNVSYPDPTSQFALPDGYLKQREDLLLLPKLTALDL
jgi:chromosome segregation ATPase